MYCINCGVKLEETEKKCPLCNTIVNHPDVNQVSVKPLYPNAKMPLNNYSRKGLCGVILILFFIPLIISLYSDLQMNDKLDWFIYVAGSLVVSYVVFALPLWFKKPNPVIFAPCSFLTSILFLMVINYWTNGTWFLSFALPISLGISLITCSVITLLYYLKKGKLYIWGGAFILTGCLICLIEHLLVITFSVSFIGWSIYPLVVLVLLGFLLIYLAINNNARKAFERKLFI